MHCRHVIGLVEIVHHDLPIAGHDGRQGDVSLPRFEFIARPIVPDRSEEFLEALAIRIHVHPNKACEGFAGNFFEPQLAAGVAFRKVLCVRRELEFTVNIECPTVIAANESIHLAAGITYKLISAVLADVVEGLDAAVGLPHHENGFRPYIFFLPISRIWHLGFATEQ